MTSAQEISWYIIKLIIIPVALWIGSLITMIAYSGVVFGISLVIFIAVSVYWIWMWKVSNFKTSGDNDGNK